MFRLGMTCMIAVGLVGAATLGAGGATSTLIASRGNLAPDVWPHVAASYDGAHLRLFVDGTNVGTAPKTGKLDANARAAVWIGANPPDGYGGLRGVSDEVRIYRSALTADGVAAAMQNARPSTHRAASSPDSSSPPTSAPPTSTPPSRAAPRESAPAELTAAGDTAGASGPDGVTITEGTDEGLACFQVVAVAGSVRTTYFYSKAGAAFSSLVDRDGADWIGHHPDGGSAGHFRGIPNLGDEFGHPHSSGATSTTGDPLGVRLPRATITSTKGGWKSVWQFFPTHARMTLESAGGSYWLLYEGTPGGKIGGDDFIWLCNGERFSCFDYPQGRRYGAAIRNTSGVAAGSEWAAFADGARERSLIYLHTADETPDEYWQMQDNMTVFGFGRTGLRRHLTPATVPQTLVLALVESRDPATVRGLIERLWRQ